MLFPMLVSNSFAEEYLQDELLIVSNYPEKLNGPGLILNETFNEQSLRVFLHFNDYKEPIDLVFMFQMMIKKWLNWNLSLG